MRDPPRPLKDESDAPTHSLSPSTIMGKKVLLVGASQFSQFRGILSWPKLKSELSQASLLLAHWYSRELVALPEIRSVAPGVKPSVFGSSGTFETKLSSASLKRSIPQLLTFLTFLPCYSIKTSPITSNQRAGHGYE